MIYHEASHALLPPKHGIIAKELAVVASRANLKVPRHLWHALLFYTCGAQTRTYLATQGLEHQPYMVRNKVFASFYPLLQQHWQPYLNGELTREQALQHLLEALHQPPTPGPP